MATVPVTPQTAKKKAAWPNPDDYNNTVQNPTTVFKDTDLMASTAATDPIGLPLANSGNFGQVYKMTSSKGVWALKCFTRQVPDQQQRYEAVSKALASSGLRYAVEFRFTPEGIKVHGEWFPIVKMEWCGGTLLHEYIQQHVNDANMLHQLAQHWVLMIETLKKAGLAHGDLQPGNVLLVGQDLTLIDYDGMYVPALAGMAASERGLDNFQHPLRRRQFGPFLDHFASRVIYTSIAALAVNPGLSSKYGLDSDKLLFCKDDFKKPLESELFKELTSHNNAVLKDLALDLQGMLLQKVEELQPLGRPPFPGSTGPIQVPTLAPRPVKVSTFSKSGGGGGAKRAAVVVVKQAAGGAANQGSGGGANQASGFSFDLSANVLKLTPMHLAVGGVGCVLALLIVLQMVSSSISSNQNTHPQPTHTPGNNWFQNHPNQNDPNEDIPTPNNQNNPSRISWPQSNLNNPTQNNPTPNNQNNPWPQGNNPVQNNPTPNNQNNPNPNTENDPNDVVFPQNNQNNPAQTNPNPNIQNNPNQNNWPQSNQNNPAQNNPNPTNQNNPWTQGNNPAQNNQNPTNQNNPYSSQNNQINPAQNNPNPTNQNNPYSSQNNQNNPTQNNPNPTNQNNPYSSQNNQNNPAQINPPIGNGAPPIIPIQNDNPAPAQGGASQSQNNQQRIALQSRLNQISSQELGLKMQLQSTRVTLQNLQNQNPNDPTTQRNMSGYQQRIDELQAQITQIKQEKLDLNRQLQSLPSPSWSGSSGANSNQPNP